MRSATLRMVALLVLAGVGGCGQKGPLYLPDRTRSSVPAAPATPTTPAAQPVTPAAPPAPPAATAPAAATPPASPDAAH